MQIFAYIWPDKSKVENSQNFVAFWEYMNFNYASSETRPSLTKIYLFMYTLARMILLNRSHKKDTYT